MTLLFHSNKSRQNMHSVHFLVKSLDRLLLARVYSVRVQTTTITKANAQGRNCKCLCCILGDSHHGCAAV